MFYALISAIFSVGFVIFLTEITNNWFQNKQGL